MSLRVICVRRSMIAFSQHYIGLCERDSSLSALYRFVSACGIIKFVNALDVSGPVIR